MKMGRIKPYENGPSEVAEKYIKLTGGEIEHPLILEMFDYKYDDVSIFGEPDKTEFYLIKSEEHTTKPEYSLLICVFDLRTILDREELIYLQYIMQRLIHPSRSSWGGVELYYYSIDETVLMLNVEDVDDGQLVEEFLRKNKFVWEMAGEQDENTNNGKQDN